MTSSENSPVSDQDSDDWSEAEAPPAGPPPDGAREALARIESRAAPGKAEEMAAFHKVARHYLGTANPEIDALTREWRAGLSLDGRLALAAQLWATNVHEGRIAAAKLLVQARLRPDTAAWGLICAWVSDFDAWAIADQVAVAGQKRVMADLSRLDTLAAWTQSPHLWTRRAALTFTQPLTRLNFPKPAELAAREHVLDWAADLAEDGNALIQKAVAGWLRDLSRHAPERTREFLSVHGDRLKPFARKEAGANLD